MLQAATGTVPPLSSKEAIVPEPLLATAPPPEVAEKVAETAVDPVRNFSLIFLLG